MENDLQKALDEFKLTVPEKRLDVFRRTTFRSLQACVLLIQRDQEKLKGMMDFTRISTFIEALRQFDRALFSFVTRNKALDDLSPCIWGPTKSIIEMAKENPIAFDLILETYERFGTSLPLMDEHQEALQEQPVCRVCLAWVYRDILRFHSEILKLFKNRDWAKTFAVNRRDYDGRFEALLQSFDSHKTALTNASYIQTHGPDAHVTQSLGAFAQRQQQMYDRQRDPSGHQQLQRPSELQDISSGLQERINDMMMRQQENSEDIQSLILDGHFNFNRFIEEESKIREKRRKENQSNRVKQWLQSPGDQNAEVEYHQEFQRIRDKHPDAGTWLFKDLKIKSWMEDEIPDSSLLWVKGRKGSGKTILASRMIDYLLAYGEGEGEGKGWKTSYFYCREGIGQLTEAPVLSILKSLLTQMMDNDENETLLPTLHDRTTRGPPQLKDEQIAVTLLKMFADVDMNQFIVIDGLDELERSNARRIADILGDIIQRSDDKNQPGKIRLLFFSTELDFIDQFISNKDRFSAFSLSPMGIATDIQRFVSKRFDELADVYELNEDEKISAKLQICENSNGIFLYASLVMENLKEQPEAEALLEELQDTFPKNYQEVYLRIIKRLRATLHPRMWEKSKRILGWLAYAKRPLKLYELQAALATTTTSQGQLSGRYPRVELRHDIRYMCGPLVHMIGDSRIEFSHSLAREFVMKNQELDPHAVECDLTFHCLDYLSNVCFDKGLSPESREQYAKEGQYAFQDYAMSQWPAHLEEVIKNSTNVFNTPNESTDYTNKAIGTLDFFRRKRKLDPIHFKQDQGNIEEEVKRKAKEQCEGFEGFEFHEDLLRACTHIKGHSKQALKERNKVSIKELREVLADNREILSKLASELDDRDPLSENLRKFYGTNFFKCDCVTCPYFYLGFQTPEELTSHSNRHERPFPCTVPNCSHARFGFSSNKDLEKHLKNYHPEAADQRGLFTPLNQRLVENTKHSCEDCGKNFTRKANLDAHMNSAHLGLRPFSCSTCGKAFTRNNDRKRHEKLHVRRQR